MENSSKIKFYCACLKRKKNLMCYINSQQTLFEESIVVVGTIPVAARDHSYYFLSLKLLEKEKK